MGKVNVSVRHVKPTANGVQPTTKLSLVLEFDHRSERAAEIWSRIAQLIGGLLTPEEAAEFLVNLQAAGERAGLVK